MIIVKVAENSEPKWTCQTTRDPENEKDGKKRKKVQL